MMNIPVNPKRPWTIKTFVVVFGLLYGLGLSQFLYDSTRPIALVYNLSIVISVFGIWQGRYWARNLFFILSMPVILLLLLVSGALLLNHGLQNVFSVLWGLLVLILYFLIFFKPSQEWFREMNSDQIENNANNLSWQLQLMIVFIAIILGTLADAINSKFDLIPLASELGRNFVSPYSKIVLAVSINSVGFLIGASLTLLPFAILLGIWRNTFRFLIGRLMGIGVTISSIFIYFVLGNSDRINIYMALFFLASVMTAMLMIYVGLLLSREATLIYEKFNFKKLLSDKNHLDIIQKQ